jgi:transposase
MEYPAAVLEKAQRLEQLLQRVDAGEALDEANKALGFSLDQHQLTRWQAKYEAGGRQWQALIDGRHGHPRTASSTVREWLYARKEENEALRAPHLVIEIKEQFGVELSAGHINYLLRKRGLTDPGCGLGGRGQGQQEKENRTRVPSTGAGLDTARK